jgi:predicted TIM-barrel fold metal-dependent hydrolase
MEIIDFHTHTFPDELAPRAIAALISNSPESTNHTDGTLNGLKNSMWTNGITRSVVLPVATKTSQVSAINRNCISLSGSGIIPFGALHPEMENFQEEINFLKSNKIPGIKFHPEYQNFYIDSPTVFPIYEALSQAGLIVVFHAGMDPGPFTNDHVVPSMIRKVHKSFPDLLIVAAHMGGWKMWGEVKEYLCALPVYFDTSAVTDQMSKDDFVKIVRLHGAEKILFGTDSPWFDQGEVRRWIEETSLTDSEKERIFCRNANELFSMATGSKPEAQDCCG